MNRWTNKLIYERIYELMNFEINESMHWWIYESLIQWVDELMK